MHRDRGSFKSPPTSICKTLATTIMTTRNISIAMTIILILSTIGMSVWLFEILKIKSWYGLNWLSGQLYSPYIATLIAVFAFMTPFIFNKQTTTKKIILAIIILYAANMLCFEAGKQLCYAMYCSFCFRTSKDSIFLFTIATTLFAFLGFAYWFVTNKLIKKNKNINMLTITLLALAVIPLSLLTIQVNTGFGTNTDWIDSVKMGYPIFWTITALGLSGILIAKQKTILATKTI